MSSFSSFSSVSPSCHLFFFHFVFLSEPGWLPGFIYPPPLLTGDTQRLAAASIPLFSFHSSFPSASNPIFLTEQRMLNAKCCVCKAAQAYSRSADQLTGGDKVFVLKSPAFSLKYPNLPFFCSVSSMSQLHTNRRPVSLVSHKLRHQINIRFNLPSCGHRGESPEGLNEVNNFILEKLVYVLGHQHASFFM